MFEIMDTDKDGVIDDKEIAAIERIGMLMQQKMLLSNQNQSPAAASR